MMASSFAMMVLMKNDLFHFSVKYSKTAMEAYIKKPLAGTVKT